jgi:hypothetical protein
MSIVLLLSQVANSMAVVGFFFPQSGASNDAIELFEEMQKLGVRPDRITYVGVISATTASGQWDLAQSFIRKMQVCTLVCFS